MARLGDDAMIEVFIRLPRASILSCRRVSRSWRTLLSDPFFVRRYRSRNPSLLGFYHYVLNNQDFLPQFIPTARSDDLRATISRTSSFSLEGARDHEFFNSCNGWLFFHNFRSDGRLIFYACHPLNEQQVELPSPPFNWHHRYIYIGSVSEHLGDSPSFRVVLVVSSRELLASPVEIHTFSSEIGRWSMALSSNSCPFFPSCCSSRPAAFIDGAFHWLHSDGEIIVYDEGSSHLSTILLPRVNELRIPIFDDGCLGKSEDSRLCYVTIDDSLVYLWTLISDSSPEASWSLEHCICLRTLIRGHPHLRSNIAFEWEFHLSGFRGGRDPVVIVRIMHNFFSFSLITRELGEVYDTGENFYAVLALPYEAILEPCSLGTPGPMTTLSITVQEE